MDEKAVAQVLAGTYHPDSNVRKQAEEHLAKMEQMPGYISMALKVLAAEVPTEVKQAAVLRLKNICTAMEWSIQEGDGLRISLADRQTMRANILNFVVTATHSNVRVHLLQVLSNICKTDWPANFPTLVPDILNLIKTRHPSKVYGAVCALHALLKNFLYKTPEGRAPVNPLVETTFGVLLELGKAVSEQTTLPAMEMFRMVIKTLYVAVQFAMPPYIAKEEVITAWMGLALNAMKKKIPQDQLPKDSDDQEEELKHPLWRTKKWCARMCLRTFQRYGREKYVSDEAAPFARLYFAKFSQPILSMFMTVLADHVKKQTVHRSVLRCAYSYIQESCKFSSLYKLMKPHLKFLLLEAVSTTMCLTENDVREFSENPEEYVRKELDVMEEYQDPRLAAQLMLVTFLQDRTRDTRALTLAAITQIMEAYKAAPAPQKRHVLKECAMRMFGSLARLLVGKGKQQFAGAVEGVLLNHVVTEFGSQYGYLRSRTCSVVGEYAKHKWSNPKFFKAVMDCLYKSLRDKELVVRLEACGSLCRILRNGDKTVRDMIVPMVPLILNQFFTLFDSIGSEELMITINNLIEVVGKRAAPYAENTAKKMLEVFKQLCTAPPSDDGAMLTAQQALKGVAIVMGSVGPMPDLFIRFEPLVKDVILDNLCEERVEFAEDVLDLCTLLTYFSKDITPFQWTLMGKMFEVYDSAWGGTLIDNMIPSLDNYISRGGDAFINAHNGRYVNTMLGFCKKILDDPKRHTMDCQYACKLLGAVFAHHKGKIDKQFPAMIETVSKRFFLNHNSEPADRSLSLSKALLDVTAFASFYNPQLLLQVLHASNNLDFFNAWLSYLPELKGSRFHQRLAAMGLTAIMHVPVQQLPPPIAKNLHHVVEQATGVLVNIMLEEAAGMYDEEDEETRWDDSDEDEDEEEEEEEEEDGAEAKEDGDGDDDDDEEAEAAFDDTQFKDIDESHDVDDEEEISELKEHYDKIALYSGLEAKNHHSDKEVDTNYATPLDKIDEFIFFSDSLQTLSKREKQFYTQWTKCLSPDKKKAFQNVLDKAATIRKVMEQEEARAKAAKEKKEAAKRAAAMAAAQGANGVPNGEKKKKKKKK